MITTVAGDGTYGFSGDGGPATAAQMNSPNGVAVDPAGNVYFCDTNNHRVRKISTSEVITTIAGTGVMGFNGDNIQATTANIREPSDVFADTRGNLFIAVPWEHRIRKLVLSTAVITTVAGDGQDESN